MIKIIYEQKPYYYEHAGQQPWDTKSEITLDSDISSDYAVLAFIKMLAVAGFHIKTDKDAKELLDKVKDLIDFEGI